MYKAAGLWYWATNALFNAEIEGRVEHYQYCTVNIFYSTSLKRSEYRRVAQ
jgi:hypothetical protein